MHLHAVDGVVGIRRVGRNEFGSCRNSEQLHVDGGVGPRMDVHHERRERHGAGDRERQPDCKCELGRAYRHADSRWSASLGTAGWRVGVRD